MKVILSPENLRLWDRRTLKDVVPPRDIEKIGEYWFCESVLEKIVIPSNVKEIQEGAFRNCENLRKVVFEEGSALKKIGPNAFYGCIRFTNIIFPEGLEEIDLYAFYLNNIDCVSFPSSFRTVAQGAFANCMNLKVVKFNEGLEVLGTDDDKHLDGVFQGSALESVQLP